MSHHLHYEAEELIIYNLIPQDEGSPQYEQADIEPSETGNYRCECGEQFDSKKPRNT